MFTLELFYQVLKKEEIVTVNWLDEKVSITLVLDEPAVVPLEAPCTFNMKTEIQFTLEKKAPYCLLFFLGVPSSKQLHVSPSSNPERFGCCLAFY